MAKEFSDRDELVSKRTSGKTVAKVESGEESSLVEADETVDDEIEMESEPVVKTPAVPSKTAEKTPVEKPPVKPYQPKIPFPQRLRKAKIKENCKKKKLEEAKTTVLSAEVSAIIKNEIPPKLEDPGSFLISCAFGAVLYKALADLGASINLMPYSVYKRLSLGDLTPTCMSIRLADRSFQYPMEIAENLQIRVGHMIFPVDFVVLEMEADINVPLILGRPFLMTADAIIRVKAKEISLGVGDDRD
uniref:uncharacterized protein LOC122608894 n=1 Tax=Erigeron canadensis TaxID=72917 RepID=UPI001CB9140A|nr:uncharacterized protein LOC122608894 [Erigeron canadensis]